VDQAALRLGVAVSAAFFQSALVGRARVDAAEKIKKLGPCLVEAGTRSRLQAESS